MDLLHQICALIVSRHKIINFYLSDKGYPTYFCYFCIVHIANERNKKDNFLKNKVDNNGPITPNHRARQK